MRPTQTETDVSKTTVTVPQGKGKKWWKGLSAEQKKAITYPRLEAGDSNRVIGERFGVTPNSIASMRNKWNIENKKAASPPVAVPVTPKPVSPKETKTKRRSAKKKRTKKQTAPAANTGVAQQESPLPIVELTEVKHLEEAATPITAAEVEAAFKADIGAAADAVMRAQKSSPAQTTPVAPRALPRRFVAEVIDPHSCRCPVPGKALGKEARCGETPVVYSGMCEEHATILFGNWRAKLKK